MGFLVAVVLRVWWRLGSNRDQRNQLNGHQALAERAPDSFTVHQVVPLSYVKDGNLQVSVALLRAPTKDA